MALAQSFMLSFVILASRGLPPSAPHTLDSLKGTLVLLASIVPLLYIVSVSKVSIQKYGRSEKNVCIVLGLVFTYPVALFCLRFSIALLHTLGGD